MQAWNPKQTASGRETAQAPGSTKHQGDDAADERAASPRARLPRPVREQQMLDSAAQLFGEHGYHAVSMDQIAESVGLSKPMLYAYFDSKEGLCAACLKRAGADAVNAITMSFQASITPEESLFCGLTAFLKFVENEPSSWKLIRDHASYDVDAFQEMVNEIHDDLRQVIEDLTLNASRETAADPFSDDRFRSAFAWSLFGAASAMADRWLRSDTQAPAEDCVSDLMNFFWIGERALGNGEVWKPINIKI